jgi:hypothetical protein
VEYHVDYLLGYYDSVPFGRNTTYYRVPSTGIRLLPSYSLPQLSDVAEAVESVGEDNGSGDNALSGAEVNQVAAQALALPACLFGKQRVFRCSDSSRPGLIGTWIEKTDM